MSRAIATHAPFSSENGGFEACSALRGMVDAFGLGNAARTLDFAKGYISLVLHGRRPMSPRLRRAIERYHGVARVAYGRASVIEPLTWTDADGRELPQAEPWRWWDGGRVEELMQIE